MKRTMIALALMAPIAAHAEGTSPYALPALGDIYNECVLHRVDERAALMAAMDKEKKLEAQVAALTKERDALKAAAKPTAPEPAAPAATPAPAPAAPTPAPAQ